MTGPWERPFQAKLSRRACPTLAAEAGCNDKFQCLGDVLQEMLGCSGFARLLSLSLSLLKGAQRICRRGCRMRGDTEEGQSPALLRGSCHPPSSQKVKPQEKQLHGSEAIRHCIPACQIEGAEPHYSSLAQRRTCSRTTPHY